MFCRSSLFIAALLCLHVACGSGVLKGKTLLGCILLEKPYVVRDTTRRRGYSGVAITYLEKLEEELEFRTDFRLWNTSWNDFIDKMSSCDTSSDASPNGRCPCDIGIGSFTMTNERHEKIDFIAPFSNEAHRMVSRKSDLRVDDSNSIWFVFKTFTPKVWMIITVGVFMHAIGTVFFGPFQSRHRKRPSTIPSSSDANVSQDTTSSFMQPSQFQWVVKRFPAACLFAYAHLVGHPFGERPQGTPSFHRSAWLVLGVTAGLFLLTVYEASLTVILFESTKSSPFRTLNDFKECYLEPSRVAIMSGGASQKFWDTAVIQPNRDLCKWTGKTRVPVSNIAEGFDAVRDGDADFFYTLEGSVITRANGNCDKFQVVGEPFFSTSVAFIMPKNHNSERLKGVHAELSDQTRILREQDGYPSASLLALRNSCDDVVDATITAGKLTAFFIMYAIGWGVLLIYRIVFLYKRKKDPNKEEDFSLSNSGDNIFPMTMHEGAFRGIWGNRRRYSENDPVHGHTPDPQDEQPQQPDAFIGYESQV